MVYTCPGNPGVSILVLCDKNAQQSCDLPHPHPTTKPPARIEEVDSSTRTGGSVWCVVRGANYGAVGDSVPVGSGQIGLGVNDGSPMVVETEANVELL